MTRLPLALGLLLLAASLTHAEQVVLSWDYPLDWQPDTTYTLHVVTLQGGAPSATTRTIAPFPPQQCAQWPDPGHTPETLCGAVCLEPGDYTLSLVAIHGGQQSAPSNLLDVDLTSTTSCTPAASAPPASPTPPAQPAGGSETGPVAGGLVLGGAAAALLAAQHSVPSWVAMPNMNCVTYAVTGVCLCTPFTPCVSVQYWEPGWFVEVVKKPTDTLVPLLGDVLQAALASVGAPAFGGGGAGNSSGSGQTNLHFGEVHIYTYPQFLGGPCTSCSPSTLVPTVHYASEIDPLWRTAVAVPSPLDVLRQVGVWGRLFPRSGKVIHGSEPVASALMVARAVNIAVNPVGEPPNVEARVVLRPIEGPGLCQQMAYPKQTMCMPSGTPPPLWETGALSLSGRYGWIIWRKRTCCVNPNQATCGITLPGVGRYGENFCPL